jgi:hypothetical protein
VHAYRAGAGAGYLLYSELLELLFDIVTELVHRRKYPDYLFLARVSGHLDIRAIVSSMVADLRLNLFDAAIFHTYDVIEYFRI